ncbi:MAG: glycosyltransferase family 2 protein, partial [Proteobacteria bacterium]|nr:glycosyltransferase family 2 protein [Verrucomicrobiota bacterium]NBU11432.1 glycosyltransferase family 2 protein [Pseudomonadota bacterium]
HHASNRGKGAAIRTALPSITSPWVLIQDADLEYDPQDYETLLAPVRNGLAEVVYGSRFAGTGWRQSLKLHTLQNRLLTAVSNLPSGLRLSDSATCYKLFRSDLLKGLTLKENRFGFCPEVTAKLARAGVRIHEVPVRYQGRTHAEGKKLRLRDGLSALRCILVYNCRP